MRLEILDINRFIKENDVKEVTSTLFFTGNLASEGGVFDPEIFGYFQEEERHKFGYIDLRDIYLHPLVVINLSRMGSLGSILLQHDNPKKKWAKVVDGKITYVAKDEQGAESGKAFYINNFDKIDWNKTLLNLSDEDIDEYDEIEDVEELEKFVEDNLYDFSVSKQGRINFIKSLKKDEFFIDKWLVIPKGFRNISSEHRTLGSDINKEYRKLLTNINALRRFQSSSFFKVTRIQEYLIQNVILVNLFKDTIGFITGKRVNFDKTTNKPAPTVGVAKNSNFQEKIIGKSVDFSSRNVIIAPTVATKNTYKEVDALAGYAGIPLATICSSFMPFVLKYAIDIIKTLELNIERQVLKWDIDFIRVEPASKLFIERLLKNFIKSDTGRFDPFNFIMVYQDENKRIIKKQNTLTVNVASNMDDFKKNKYDKRFFTITDLFYQAAVEAIKDRYVFLVRYPVLNHLNIFPSGINLLSTKKERGETVLLYNFNVNWEDPEVPSDAIRSFPKYPMIPVFKQGSTTELKRTTEENTFINALIPGNTSLKSIGGDYDGDTLSVIGLYSEEANKAAKEYINSPGYFIGATNKNIRSLESVGKEFVMGLYMLTRN